MKCPVLEDSLRNSKELERNSTQKGVKKTVPQGDLISKGKTKNELRDKQRYIYIYI
jgi:hypothetical protein